MVYAKRGFPFTGKQVCVLAYEMAARDNNKGFNPVKRKAGRCWLKGFYKRHPEIWKKTSINLSIGSAIAANPVQIGRFFDQYTQWLEDWGLECAPNRICERSQNTVLLASTQAVHKTPHSTVRKTVRQLAVSG